MSDFGQLKINWWNCLRFWYMNIAGVFALFIQSPSWSTSVFLIILGILSILGISVGAHRCLSHKSFKVKRPLKLIFFALQTLTFQGSILDWVKRHRMHHRFTGTCADPYNFKNGFWFSHCYWICYDRHPEYEKQCWRIDMRDLKNDPTLKLQHKYNDLIAVIFNLAFPMIIGCDLFGEKRLTMWHYNMLRIVIVYHITSITNSLSHFYGSRPYDKAISAADSKLVSCVTLGEGSQNYHHTFPNDYRASEYSNYWLNPTTALIDFFLWRGWASNLNIISRRDIRNRILRTGDGSHRYSIEIADLLNRSSQ